MALPSGPPRHVRPLPVVAAWLIRACMPYAERDEVVSDLAAEHAERVRERGRVAAGVWLWRQVAGSIPALVRRVLWRGRTGFEPAASYLRPGGPVVEHWIVDTRYSIRRLSSRPAYAVMAVLTLALGSAGLAATYSVIDATLLQPLPVADESRVGVFWSDGSWTEQEFLFLRNGVPGIARLAAYRPSDATLERPGEPLRLVPGLAATSELFDVLGGERNLGVALDARAAVRRLADGRDARIDLGLAEWDDGTRRHFVNAAGVGFDAEVARRARARGGAGTIPYVLAVVAALRAHRAVAARLEVGGAPGWTGALTAAIVANGAHYGGGMKIAPGADPADGRLDLVVLGAFGRLELLRWLPTVYRGGHVAHPSVRVQPVTRVRVEADAPLPTHLDGESGPPSPVTLGVRPAALRLRV